MSEIDEAFIARLKTQSGVTDLIGDGASPVNIRVYPNSTKKNPVLPVVVYTKISAVREQDFSGIRGAARSRYQFDVLAETYTDAFNLAKALRLALDGFAGTSLGVDFLSTTLENEFDSFEGDSELNRMTMDFVFYHSESTS